MTNPIHTTWASIAPTVTVVAVVKTFPFEAVATAHAMGFRHIGENRVEEALGKIKEAKEKGYTDILWHMIGHVQRRKAKDVVKLFDWVDSVDSVALAQKLDELAQQENKKLHIFLEVNLSGEKQKFGFDMHGWDKERDRYDTFIGDLQKIMSLPHLTIEGIMTMAPYARNAEENRSIFRSMKKLSQTIGAQISGFGTQLSMGTSADYQVAIQEGATQVRLGEALFGKRNIAK